ncbi:hypothetical protein CDD82_5777 [Ophiocordyceps australis]|uniref:Uncharacterized protein n=1 Tax=Ophiocordyceps australis TaxID=1399860 RepID=A0A2C5YZR4_9HYPO|nr:hypothetical protein CDD82_5777 [Ophiocordyceps australis]
MWRNGSLEALKFPEFRQELLQQSHWSPADAFGRIKVLISEGLARDSMTMATERIKNIVAFSFQHAPLDILEMSSIAWPNPSMWRRTPLVSSMAVPSNHADEADSHAHSPRRRPVSMQGNATSMGTPFTQDMAYRPGLAAGARHVSQPASGTVGFNLTDPFGDAAAYLDWLGSMDASLGATLRSSNQENTRHANPRRQNTDISMPDYVPMTSGDQGAVASEHPNAGHGLGHEDETGTNQLKVPTNTPTTGGQGNLDAQDGMSYPAFSQPTPIPCDLATSLTNSLLNQPMPLHFPQSSFHELVPVVRSRKEKRSQLPDAQLPAASIAGQEQQEMRRVSQQMYIPSGGSMPVCNVAMQKDSPQAPDNGGVGTQAGTKGAVLACGEANSEQDFFCKDGITAQPLNSPCGIMTERGNKRLRNLTPGSSRGLDDDDEPRRASSRATCSPLVTETEERK